MSSPKLHLKALFKGKYYLEGDDREELPPFTEKERIIAGGGWKNIAKVGGREIRSSIKPTKLITSHCRGKIYELRDHET